MLVSGSAIEAPIRARASKSFFSMATESLTDWTCSDSLKPYITICCLPFPCHNISFHASLAFQVSLLLKPTTGSCKPSGTNFPHQKYAFMSQLIWFPFPGHTGKGGIFPKWGVAAPHSYNLILTARLTSDDLGKIGKIGSKFSKLGVNFSEWKCKRVKKVWKWKGLN